MERKTHSELIMNHLAEHGNITIKQAFEKYGITNLRDPIYHLRKNGVDIISTRIPFKNRQGLKSHYVEYSMQ